MAIIHVRGVPDPHVAALQRRADRDGLSVSAVVRGMIARIAKVEARAASNGRASEGTINADVIHDTTEGN